MAKWKVGDRIENRWKVVETRFGGMGVVYIVQDARWGIQMAAKGLQENLLASDPSAAVRFVREAKVWLGLDCHPNIAQAILVKEVLGQPLIFLEFVESDLAHWVRTGRLANKVGQVLELAISFCDGMTYAYSRGVHAHRDVKPSNCLITPDGTLKVTDFGLASVMGPGGGSGIFRNPVVPVGSEQGRPPRLTPTGAGMGTPAYMAPEQFLDAGHVAAQADVYSFGIMLYEMLTGNLPFCANGYLEWAHLHATAAVPNLPGLLPTQLNVLIQECVAKDPTLRPVSFDGIRSALAELYEGAVGKPAKERAVSPELDSAQWRRKGIGLAELDLFEEALKCFEESLKCDSQDTATWQCKGVTLARMGRRREGLECTERAIELDPTSKEAWGSKAVDLLELGRAEEALATVDHAIQLDADDWNLLTIKAVILDKLRRFDEALAFSDRSLQLYPLSDLTWAARCSALRGLGRSSEALDSAGQAISLNRNSVGALRHKAEILIESGRAEDSIELLDKAIDLNQKRWELWWDKGIALSILRKVPEQQVECFGRCAELAPTLTVALYEKGTSLHELGRIDEALKCYEEVLVREPNNKDALKAKTILLRELGRAGEALAFHDRLLELDPSDATAWNDKGATFCALRQPDKALECFDQALAIDPNHRLALLNKASVSG